MNVIEKNLTDIKPYEKNPRKNDDAVQYVAESIKQFGFKVPIVIDKDGVIVAGHTRYKAAKKLNLSTVPCVVADDLTEEQIRAYRLADNKVSEKSAWDFDLLFPELDDIAGIDMTDFGFVFPEENAIDFDDLDKDDESNGTYVINIRFDRQEMLKKCKDEIEHTVENFGGRLSVKME